MFDSFQFVWFRWVPRVSICPLCVLELLFLLALVPPLNHSSTMSAANGDSIRFVVRLTGEDGVVKTTVIKTSAADPGSSGRGSRRAASAGVRSVTQTLRATCRKPSHKVAVARPPDPATEPPKADVGTLRVFFFFFFFFSCAPRSWLALSPDTAHPRSQKAPAAKKKRGSAAGKAVASQSVLPDGARRAAAVPHQPDDVRFAPPRSPAVVGHNPRWP